MIWKSIRPLLLIIYNDVVKPLYSGSIGWYDWIEIKLENLGIPTYNYILMTNQNFYSLFHVLYRERTNLLRKVLLTLHVQKSFGNYVTELSFTCSIYQFWTLTD